MDGKNRHYTEHCTAVAVQPGPNPLYLSAWHCFEGYQEHLPITLLESRSGVATKTNLKLIAHGGTMESDWAILRPEALSIFPEEWLRISANSFAVGQKVQAAGYCANGIANQSITKSGHLSRILLNDMDCSIIKTEGTIPATDCDAKKGSSGGAIVTQTKSGNIGLIGIISKGDGATKTYFFPVKPLLDRIGHF